MPSRDYKGNKAALPSKPCQCCGRTMSWRKSWARNWDEVRYCSDRCRRVKNALPGDTAHPAEAAFATRKIR